MQLNQPIPPAPGHNEDPYDFILNGAAKSPRSSRLGINHQSTKHRLLVAGGGLIILIFVVVVAWGLLSRGPSNANLLAVAQSQTELIRVSTLGVNQLQNPDDQNFAQTILSSLTSEQQQSVSYLSSHGHKPSAKELALGQNSQTDKSFAAATNAGDFDSVFTANIEQTLATYQQQLTTVYKATTATKERALLQQYYAAVVALRQNQPAATNS